MPELDRTPMTMFRERGRHNRYHIIFYLGALSVGGGYIKNIVLMQELMARGHRVSLLLEKKTGVHYERDIERHGIETIVIGKSSIYDRVRLLVILLWRRLRRDRRSRLWDLFVIVGLRALKDGAAVGIAAYRDAEGGDFIIGHAWPTQKSVLFATQLMEHPVRVILQHGNHMGMAIRYGGSQVSAANLRVIGRFYRFFATEIDHFVTSSKGLIEDIHDLSQFSRGAITAVYNGVYRDEIKILAEDIPGHPWLADKTVPVLLAMGRINKQKGFGVLLEAFAQASSQRRLRLIIAGPLEQGSEVKRIFALRKHLNLEESVDFPGVMTNPYALMRCADLFVLSSYYEGFGIVLAEALAIGCPIISTDCPVGPAEILEHGRYGRMVPAGDIEALASAILLGLDDPRDAERLQERGRYFSAERAGSAYEAIFDSLSQSSRPEIARG